MSVCTRFAPSPTGNLHLGGIRTALYCWLCARHYGGNFILRIEDTDLERSYQEATKLIIDSMQWLGLHYDYGPYLQSERIHIYKDMAEKLVTQNSAYYCYCSKERIEILRKQQLSNKEKPRYDGYCRNNGCNKIKNKSYVIRFKNPLIGTVKFHDQVLGEVSFKNSELDDLIIIRTDGTPTYNFAAVIDDIDMKITHIIRGMDHVNNTPRQINLYNAFNADIPLFAHIPMVLDKNHAKISKRHNNSISVLQYRDQGYLPEAILNYLVRLGWSYGDQEIFSIDEMIKLFEVKNIRKSNSSFDPEKLLWLNRHYIKTLDPNIIAERLSIFMEKLNINYLNGPILSNCVTAFQGRVATLKELAEKSRYFYEDYLHYEENAKTYLISHIKLSVSVFQNTMQEIIVLTDLTDNNTNKLIKNIANKLNTEIGVVAQLLRIAVTGTLISPPLNITLRLLGKNNVLQRIDKTLHYIEKI